MTAHVFGEPGDGAFDVFHVKFLGKRFCQKIGDVSGVLDDYRAEFCCYLK